MKNILLPTDLTVQSLWPVHNIVKEAGNTKPVIHVVHLLNPPNSITDLFSLKSSKPFRSIPATFSEAFQLLCNKYEGAIDKMQFQFIYGSTARYLRNFIEGNKIDMAYMLTNYNYECPLENSVNLTKELYKCKVALRQLPLHKEALSDYQILSALLNGNEQPVEAPFTIAARSAFSYS